MNSNSYFVDECFNCSKEIELIAGALNEISHCLYRVGNPILADSLGEHADNLNLQSERIRKICADKTSKDLQEIQNATGNMLKAALNAVELNNKKD